MSTTRLHVVPTLAEAPDPSPGATIVVLDPTWVPVPGERHDLVAARRLFGDVVERLDLFDGALELVDAWADATGIADRLTVEGVTYWFRMRETMWRWLHERLLWRHALAGVVERVSASDDITEVRIPPDEPALADVARLLWPDRVVVDGPDASETDADAEAPSPSAASRGTTVAFANPVRRVVRSLLGRSAPAATEASVITGGRAGTERARREAILADRVASIVAEPTDRVLVLTNPATHQRVGAAGGDRRDPLFGAIIPGLSRAGLPPVLLATGIDHRRDDDWRLVEADDRMLPQFLLRTRWSRSADDARAEVALTDLHAAVAAVRDAPLDVDGIDLGPEFADALLAAATRVVRTDVHMLARAERLIDELEPRAVILAQEGIRTPWLIAARRAGIPSFAVQHGVLYPGHAGYPNRWHPDRCLPTRTFLYGDFERQVLLDLGSYQPDEVETVGSPRLDLDTAPTDADGRAAERRAVRVELGVADGDRLVVISTVNLRFVQRSHFAHMLEAMLCGPLPGVHLVFKQHPGEHDDGPYRELVRGLAVAGGWTAPPISVVKDVDLYRLLRAADAHLGLLSTVLTDAVAAGTPNLIALTDRHADLLGYVEAGVARPVRSPADVRAALDDPSSTEPGARAAFLARHVRTGDASARIVASVVTLVRAPVAGGGRPRPVR